jgi:malate dehydrogenase
MSEKEILRVAITGGAGRIAYSLIPLLLDGRVFGSNKLIDLRLVDIPQADMRLQGVLMEIEDCNFPCMEKITTTIDTATGFQNVEVAILLGGTPRKQGMERKELIELNAEGMAKQAKELQKHANRDVKILVVANPANTNCLAAMEAAPGVPRQNFTCLTRLDEERLRAIIFTEITKKLGAAEGIYPSDVKSLAIWGNHSATQLPTVHAATITINGHVHQISDLCEPTAFEAIIDHVQRRGAALIGALGASSAMSAANAIMLHLRSWLAEGQDEGAIFSMGIISDGNPYQESLSIPPGLVVSFPCRRVKGGLPGQVEIVGGMEVSEKLRPHLASTIAELQLEAKDLRGSERVAESKL